MDFAIQKDDIQLQKEKLVHSRLSPLLKNENIA